MKSIKKSFYEEPDEDATCLYCGRKVTSEDSSRSILRVGNVIHYAWFCKNCGEHVWQYMNWRNKM